MNSNDIILQTKFRNPIPKNERGEYDWDWSWAPITITRNGGITLEGYLNTRNAVSKDNIEDSAITENKIDHWSIRGVADPKNMTDQEKQDPLIKKSQIKKGTITDWNIADKTITGEKIAGNTITGEKIAGNTITLSNFSENMRIPANYIDVGTILPSYDEVIEDETERPISKGMIQSEAIVHSKLYNSKDKTAAADSKPPVWGENIKDESIEFNHVKNPNDYEPTIEDEMKYPINGKAHIQKRSIPLNRLSEPIYMLEENNGSNHTDFTLILYPVNGYVESHFNKYEGDSTVESWREIIADRKQMQIRDKDNPAAVESYQRKIDEFQRYVDNAEKGYYINIYKYFTGYNPFSWDSTFYEGSSSEQEDDSSEQEENVEP